MSNSRIKANGIKLTEEFLSKYRYKQPKWGFDGFGYIIYLRTYARKVDLPDGTTRLERWDETVQRIVEGNIKIEAKRLAELDKLTNKRIAELRKQMEIDYYLMFNLLGTPPGRGLWMSGTEYAENVGDAENNCWGVSMRPQAYTAGGKLKASFASVFTFDQAMKGGGVGVNVQSKYVSQFPSVGNEVQLQIICNTAHADMLEIFEEDGKVRFYSAENDTAIAIKEEYERNGYQYFRVPDSRQGWGESLQHTIDSHYEGVHKLVVDISDVRPRGAEIKGFGGIASGPSPLVKMLHRVNMIINSRVGDYVTSTEWGDIIQNIGTCVVAGNVRRTAIILIGDKDDQEYIESKNYSLDKNKVASQWRWASNNSVDIGVDTDRPTLRNLAVNIFFNGEPGYVNLELSRNFGRIIDGFVEDIDGEVEVFNPCGEVTLPNGSPCNLFEVNLPRIHQFIEAGYADESLYELVLETATKYAYRITFRPYDWEVTREIVYRHRRLGIGITGVTDWVLLKFGEKAILGFDENNNPIYNEEVANFLDKLYKIVRKVNNEHAEELEANPSIKVTTVKPSGTISLLMGVSPGQHYHWSKYMMRTVRVASNSFLLPILEQCGYRIEDQISGYEKDGTPVLDKSTKVVYFPIKAPTAEHKLFQSAYDVSLKEQAGLQAMLATYWSDNAVSATLSFHKPQPQPLFWEDGTPALDGNGVQIMMADAQKENVVIEEITDILDKYKGIIKSTSLLPHAVGTYPQMPYTTISEEEYNKEVAQIVAKPWEILKGDILADEEEVDDGLECVGGACPTK